MLTVILLSSSLLLKTCAELIDLSVKSDSLTRRFADYSKLQCGHACILVYPTTNCNSLGPDFNLTNAIVWDTIIIEDTAGVTKPFYSGQDAFPIQVRSLEYVTPAEGGDECPYIQFSFFNAQNQSTGWTYIRPGQTDVTTSHSVPLSTRRTE